MGSKIIEIFNKIAYNVLSALYQPFWAAVLLAFLTMFLYLYGKEHGWKKNSFIRNMFGTWWSVRRHIVGGANRTLFSVDLPPRLCRTGT